ncbi:hypothetical protein F8M41_023065 [Gigaspora margarita]|uniref:Uncharacterized protein n=1 Tax=Gigaspora margarita TaxID=4874 RepID=A0A8H4AE31_GIGMA|nr:hypothetical protein F8M41_023065 [Gigaspora margarita]
MTSAKLKYKNGMVKDNNYLDWLEDFIYNTNEDKSNNLGQYYQNGIEPETNERKEPDHNQETAIMEWNPKEKLVDNDDPDKSDQELLVENDNTSNKEKKYNRLKKPLEGKALHRTCEKWKQKVDKF